MSLKSRVKSIAIQRSKQKNKKDMKGIKNKKNYWRK